MQLRYKYLESLRSVWANSHECVWSTRNASQRGVWHWYWDQTPNKPLPDSSQIFPQAKNRPSALIERACSQARTITLYCRLLLIEFKKIPVFQAKFHDVSCYYKTKTTKVLPLTRSQHLYQNLPWNKAAYLHQNIWHRVLIMAARIHSRPGTI